jgi:hypothetical protein
VGRAAGAADSDAIHTQAAATAGALEPVQEAGHAEVRLEAVGRAFAPAREDAPGREAWSVVVTP